jgi:predicted nucleic acid-binding protein
VRVALDTNIIAYAEGVNGEPMKASATLFLRALPRPNLVLPVQVLGELYNVLIRKARRTRADARSAVLHWRNAVPVIETSDAILVNALDLSADHNLGFWDSVILSAAAAANCRLLLSEDFQNGFTWGGVMIANPFAAPRHPLLDALISGGPAP